MKKIFLLASTALVFFKTFSQTSDDVKNYIFKYQLLAENEMNRTGVPAAITLAQGILESGAGTSDLTRSSNNHFGIKCKSDWTGDVVYHDDDEKNECFRAYPTAEASFRDHSDFLKHRDNYAFLFQLDPTDYQGWAYGLKKAGYATEKNYPQELIQVIISNHLQDYTLAAMKIKNESNEPRIVYNSTDSSITNSSDEITVDYDKTKKNNDEDDVHQTENNFQSTVNNEAAETESNLSSNAYPAGVFEINQTKVIYAQAGVSLFALASNYNVEFNKLLEFNEMNKEDILPKNQLIFLQKKPKKGAFDFHVVKANERIEDIAQTEGVRLDNLFQYNHLSQGEEPATGEKIYLKNASPSSPRLASQNFNSAKSFSSK